MLLLLLQYNSKITSEQTRLISVLYLEIEKVPAVCGAYDFQSDNVTPSTAAAVLTTDRVYQALRTNYEYVYTTTVIIVILGRERDRKIHRQIDI